MAQFRSKMDLEVGRAEREFELLEQVYPQALARLNGEDEEWEEWKRRAIERICRQIASWHMDDPGTKAVAIINRIAADSQELLAPQRIVDDYENKKRELMFLRGERERVEEIARRAEAAYKEETSKWQRAM